MGLAGKVKRGVVNPLLKRWGSTRTKQALWDREFIGGQWNYLEATDSDPIYQYLGKYLRNGELLDLGCGSGNTGAELDVSCYTHYTGVDVSDVAVHRARERSLEGNRGERNEYICGDIETFVPTRKYDVILFRESIFYVPTIRIHSLVDRYAAWLKPNGVILVRMYDRDRFSNILHILHKHFHVLEEINLPGVKDVIVALQAASLATVSC